MTEAHGIDDLEFPALGVLRNDVYWHHGTAIPLGWLPPGAAVYDVLIVVTEAFDVPALIQVGTADAPGLFLEASESADVRRSTGTGTNLIGGTGAGTQIFATLTAPGATAGRALCAVLFVPSTFPWNR